MKGSKHLVRVAGRTLAACLAGVALAAVSIAGAEQSGAGGEPAALAAAVTGYPIADYETYPPGSGQTRYLDSVNGSDTTGDGTLGNPWRTLPKALASAVPGDTVILRAGSYGLFQDWTPSAPADWITFRAYPGEQAVFDGGISLRFASGLADAYYRFDGIRIERASGDITDILLVRNLEFRNCTFRGGDKYLAGGIRIDRSENILFYHNDISNIQRGFTQLESRRITYGGNHLHDLGGGTAFQYAGGNEDTIIERNYAHHSIWDPEEPNAPPSIPHSSAISVRSNDVIIRENVFHQIGSSSAIMTYVPDAAGGEASYSDILIENNLMYDIQNVYLLRFYNLGERVTVRNNTVAGSIAPGVTFGASRMNTALAVHTLAAGSNGSGLTVANNIFIGAVDMPAAVVSRNNIYWSLRDTTVGFVYKCAPPDSGSTVLTCSESDPTGVFTSGFFVQTPVFDPGHGLALDYHLAAGSPAELSGHPQYQPGFGMGSIDGSGFILEDGAARTVDFHSAGCYQSPGLALNGAPADRTLRLAWSTNAVLPPEVTWRITYTGPAGNEPSPISGIAGGARSYSLTGLTNYQWYSVTLEALNGGDVLLTDTITLFPSDRQVFLPVTWKSG